MAEGILLMCVSCGREGIPIDEVTLQCKGCMWKMLVRIRGSEIFGMRIM